jgi:Predicted methylated DNA-protein cysteine methyltransferase
MNEDLIYEILSVVAEIPAGCIATYGQIARLIGREKNARLVGKVLSMHNIMVIIPVIEWLITPDG